MPCQLSGQPSPSIDTAGKLHQRSIKRRASKGGSDCIPMSSWSGLGQCSRKPFPCSTCVGVCEQCDTPVNRFRVQAMRMCRHLKVPTFKLPPAASIDNVLIENNLGPKAARLRNDYEGTFHSDTTILGDAPVPGTFIQKAPFR